MITQTLVISVLDWNTVSVADLYKKHCFIQWFYQDGEKDSKGSKGVPKGLQRRKKIFMFSDISSYLQICLFDYTLRFIWCRQVLYVAQKSVKSIMWESSQSLRHQKADPVCSLSLVSCLCPPSPQFIWALFT